jgi:hypothetical protein
MRVASRVIGIVLALAGLIFVSFSILFLLQFRPQSVLAGPRFGRPAWTGAAFAAVLGVGLLLAGWYYFTLDLDALDDIEERPASRFALYLIAHGSELKLIALVGFTISLIRLGAACFGAEWPGPWANWVLLLIWTALLATPGKNEELKADGRPTLKFVLKAGVAAFWILLLVLASHQWVHLPVPSRIVQDGLLVLLFAWEVLFFQYGALRAVATPGNILKS